MLFKGLPDIVNEHLHHWHENLILNLIENRPEMRVLDVGCGYGRLSEPIAERFPDADLTGIDISEHFVKLYEARTGHRAFPMTVENLPPTLGTFDCILCVTVLMYLEPENLKRAVDHLLGVLRPKGKLILIEPDESGLPFQTGFGIVSLLKKRARKDIVLTGGRFFRENEMINLIARAGGRVLKEYRLPVTSMFILPLTLLGRLLPMRWARSIYRVVSLLDAFLGRFKLPSIHVAYFIERG